MSANFLPSLLIPINVKIAIYQLCYLSFCMGVKLHLWYSGWNTDWCFEKRVFKRIFGPNKQDMRGGWRKLHNEKLHIYYMSQDIVTTITWRWMRWAGQVEHGGGGGGGRRSKCIKIVSDTWKKWPFWRCRHRRENTTEINLKGNSIGVG